MDCEKCEDKDVRKMFQRLDEMRVHSPGLTLFDQLEFCEYLEEILKRIKESEILREIILEAWLLVDVYSDIFPSRWTKYPRVY